MKASQIIEELQILIDRFGDKLVYVIDEDDEETESARVRFLTESDGDGEFIEDLPDRFYIGG